MDTDNSKQNSGYKTINKNILDGIYTLGHRNGRSRIWEIFTPIHDENGVEITEVVYCKSCQGVYRYNKATSNLAKHKCFSLYLSKNVSKNTIDDVEALEGDTFETRNDNLIKLIIKWMIKDCRTYDMIQSVALKRVLQEFAILGSIFNGKKQVEQLLPTETAIGKYVTEKYEECFKSVKEEIALIKEHGFGLTTKSWTDSSSKKSYVSLTIHFFKNGSLTYRLLGLRAIESEYCTSQDITEKIVQILKDFNCEISAKSIIVTNNAAEFPQTFKNNQNLPCISDLLNNVLRKAVENVPEVAGLLNACEKLGNRLKSMHFDSTLMASMQNISPYHWNTTNKMLKSLESNWQNVSAFQHQKNIDEQIKDIKIDELRAVIKSLQPFEDAIDALEENNVPTMHLVLVFLHELKRFCNTCDNEFKDLDLIEKLKENLQFQLESVVAENITTLHKMALFLYPPTKKLLQFSDSERKNIEDECIRLMTCYTDDLKPIIKEEPTTSVSKRRKLFEDFVEPEKFYDPNEVIIQELNFYKNFRILNCSNFDVLSWWELQKDSFPLLYKLSQSVLTTPASSSASQRVFFAARSLLYEKHCDFKLNEKEIEQIIFVNFNSGKHEIDKVFE